MPEFINNAFSERSVSRYKTILVKDDELEIDGEKVKLRKLVEGNGRFAIADSVVRGEFSGAQGSYQLRLFLPKDNDIYNGWTVCYRLDGWQSIRYLAIGYSTGGQFRHIKIKNPLQEAWQTFTVGFKDVVNLIQNEGDVGDGERIQDIRLYVSGVPGVDCRLSFGWGALWYTSPNKSVSKNESYQCNSELVSLLCDYFSSVNPHYKAHALAYLDSGIVGVSGDVYLEWDLKVSEPHRITESGTFAYTWHALHLAIALMVFGHREARLDSLVAARDLITQWITANYIPVSTANKYIWYDHGAAERLMALILAKNFSLINNFDSRYNRLLDDVITGHVQLLESDAFYAHNQNTRYHNHAWFQDLSLIAYAVFDSQSSFGERVYEKATDRLEDQFNNLVCRDSGYAVFVENSSGYHKGIERLVRFAGDLCKLSGRESSIPLIANELSSWTRFFQYPNGMAPTTGDTIRQAAENFSSENKDSDSNAHLTVLSKAGYGVIKGSANGSAYMISMISSSLVDTHKHEDNLSITLWFAGVEWLSDPGFISHEYEEENNKFLRSSKAHNCIYLEGPDYSKEPGLSIISGNLFEDSIVLKGEHSCYSGFTVKRNLAMSMSTAKLTIEDEVVNEVFETPNELSGYLSFQFGENVIANIHDGSIVLRHVRTEKIITLTFPDVDVSSVELVDSISGNGFMQMARVSAARVRMPDSSRKVSTVISFSESEISGDTERTS